MRLILLLLLLVVLWLLFLRLSAWLTSGRSPAGGRATGEDGEDRVAEPLVRCTACGVHVPRSRALHGSPSPRPSAALGPFCSESCRRRSGDGSPVA